ncbi:MAG: nucleotidyltransferase family protein [Clostridia bacterium]|nr:nucleotidyltransferase family protein [Clostridia bacterium]
MKGVIMAGGRGSRLMPLTNHLPKPLVPILDKPVMWYIVRRLRLAGVTDIAVTLGYMGDKIVEAFGDGAEMGVRLHYFREEKPLGTAGGVKNAASFLDEDFLVVSGDAYTDFDLGALADFHYEKGGLVTIASYRVENPSRFGVIVADQNGLVRSFEEKPLHPTSRLVNTGIYVCDRRLLHFVPDGFVDFAKDVFPALLGNLYAKECAGFWSDIGTLPTYYETNLHVVTQRQVAADAL